MPRRTEELFALAADHHIQVFWRRLLPGRAGLYVPDADGAPVILLDPWLERRERWLRATLAHELGHHFTGSPGWLILAQGHPALRAKCEASAQRWALEYLMPADEFMQAAAAGERMDELADRFWVPESWVAQRIGMLSPRTQEAA